MRLVVFTLLLLLFYLVHAMLCLIESHVESQYIR